MDKHIYDTYVSILRTELIHALGCTEPIAIAYAAATARQVLGCEPEHIKVSCSGNIVKNVKGVTVPNSGGQKGIAAAAVLGAIGGTAEKKLDVLADVTDADRVRTRELCAAGFCDCELIEGAENLFIVIDAEGGGHTVRVELQKYHTNITSILKDGVEIPDNVSAENAAGGTESAQSGKTAASAASPAPDKGLLSVKDILLFAEEVKIADIEEVLGDQIRCNSAISEAGMTAPYGAEVGRTIAKYKDMEDVRIRAQAFAAAGSDARMSGCPLPAVINSGSGNQGITVTMPVLAYAEKYGFDQDRIYRGLAVANLISIHIKRFIGNLSAYCGAVNAGCGAACGIAWMLGYGEDVISRLITNSLATIGGMVCDGAKPSCASKIAAAVDTALLSLELAIDGHVFAPGEGLVKNDVEETIQSIGRMGRVGMKSTDIEILNIMLDK